MVMDLDSGEGGKWRSSKMARPTKQIDGQTLEKRSVEK